MMARSSTVTCPAIWTEFAMMTSLPMTQSCAMCTYVMRKQRDPTVVFPVAVLPRAKAAAVGEGWSGAARGVDDFVMVHVGAGLTAGIVVNGRLYFGAYPFPITDRFCSKNDLHHHSVLSAG